MAGYRKTVRADGTVAWSKVKTFPRLPDQDDDVLIWLMRESFEAVFAADGLTVENWIDLGEVPAAEAISPSEESKLGRPATDYVWRRFEGIGVRA